MRVSPKVVGIVVLGLVVAAFLSLMGLGLVNKSSVTGLSGITRVQKPAPDFTLPLMDGGELVLSQHLGQPVVINFWASWCPPCRDEARPLERTWRAYKDKGVLIVGVDIQDTDAEGIAYLREFGITYPNGTDLNGEITVDYGVIGLPVTFFVNRDGVVERRWVGAIGEAQLVAWVEELAAGVAPSGEAEGENKEQFFEFD